MRRSIALSFAVPTLLAALLAVGLWPAAVAEEAPAVTSERLTRLGPIQPLREPTPEEFAPEVDEAPYTVLDPDAQLAPGQVGDTSIAVWNDLLMVGYSDGGTNRQVKFWYDDGAGGGTAGDALANGAEIRLVDALPAFVDPDGVAAVSIQPVGGAIALTYAGDAGDDLKLWYDDGASGGIAGDAQVQAGEIRTLDTDFSKGGEIQSTGSGQLIVLWKDASLVRLWVDDGRSGGTAGDAVVNGSEVRTLNLPADARFANGRTYTNVGGDLAVAFWSGGSLPQSNLHVWVDDGAGIGVAGDYLVNGSEDRNVAAFNVPPDRWVSVAWVDGLLAASFQIADKEDDQYFWYDDGGTAGEGTAGDLTFSNTEARTLLSFGEVGVYSNIIELGGRVAVTNQFVIPPQLKMFYDDGNDGAVADDKAAFGGELGQTDPPEARTIDSPLGGGGFAASSVVFDPDPLDAAVCDHVAVAHFNRCAIACGYPDDLALHLTTVNALAPRGLFVHDTGDHELHDPVATHPDIDLTLRWFEDGSDEGEVLITGDVTGPNTGVWLPLVENVIAFPDFMTVPVSLTAGDGDKTVFMEFRNGGCLGNITVRTITLTLDVVLSDPTSLSLSPGGVDEAILDWDDVPDAGLEGYNVYRASNLDLPGGGLPPAAWTPLNGALLAASNFTDSGATLGGGVELLYYYVTAVDTLGNESTDPPQ